MHEIYDKTIYLIHTWNLPNYNQVQNKKLSCNTIRVLAKDPIFLNIHLCPMHNCPLMCSTSVKCVLIFPKC